MRMQERESYKRKWKKLRHDKRGNISHTLTVGPHKNNAIYVIDDFFQSVII